MALTPDLLVAQVDGHGPARAARATVPSGASPLRLAQDDGAERWRAIVRPIGRGERWQATLPPRPSGHPEPAEPDPVDRGPPIRLTEPVLEVDGGTFRDKVRRYRIEAVKAVGLDEICRDGRGARWACGSQARVALHYLLRSGDLQCWQVSASSDLDWTVDCEVGGRSVAAILVREGWAVPSPGAESRFADAIRIRCARRSERVGLPTAC